MGERVTSRLFCALALVVLAGSPAQAKMLNLNGTLVGVEWNTGKFFSVNTSNAALTLIYDSGVSDLADIAFAPDGLVYGVQSPEFGNPRLYKFDLINHTTNTVGTQLGTDPVYEGGLTFGNGTLYGFNYINATRPHLFTVDTTTGLATERGLLTNPSLTTQVDRDINGVVFRSDGMLIGLDSAQGDLLVIDPATAQYSVLKHITDHLGGVGGMAIVNGVGYFVSAGPSPNGADPASSGLYSVDLFTGNYSRIGSYEQYIDPETSFGLSGLASPVPEPATAGLLALGALLLRRRVSR